MNRNAYLIVREFVASPSEQARKNALTALAVMADSEALKELVRLALNDPAPAVCERAEKEIVSLPQAKLSSVLEMLHEKIRAASDDQHQAYALLGRLRSRGVRIGRPRVSLLRRIRLARRPHGTARSAVLRSLWASLRGGAGGSLLFIVLMAAAFSGVSGDMVQLSVLPLVLLAPVVAIFALWFSTPLGSQADPLAAAAIEFGMALVTSVSLSFLLSLSMWGTDPGPRALWCVFLMFPAAMIVTRAAMLLIMGMWKSRLGNLWTGICCGTAAGVVVVSAVPLWLNQIENDTINGWWMVTVPLVAALATAFAVLDVEAHGPPLAPGLLRVAGFTPLLVLGATLWIVVGSLRGLATYPAVKDEGKVNERQTVDLNSIPASFDFSTARRQRVRVELQCESKLTYSYSLRNKAGLVEYAGMATRSNRPAVLETILDAGDHNISVRIGAAGDIDSGEILKTLSRGFRRPEQICSVGLVFTGDLQSPR